MTTVVLVHSPLLGPGSWKPVANEFATLGVTSIAPDLERGAAPEAPHWKRHAESVASAVAQDAAQDTTILVGHSGAGPLLPAIADLIEPKPVGYIFVDAGLPTPALPRKGNGGFAANLDRLYAEGRRYPEWTDADLADLVVDVVQRRRLLSEVRPQPPEFWDEVIPVPQWWPNAQCGYLRFGPNPAYDEAAAEAARRGWPSRELQGGHFHMLVEPKAVAASLKALAQEMGCLG